MELCLESFQIVCNCSILSCKFPDCLETFQIVYKLSRLSGKISDCLYLFQIVWKVSRLSGKFPDCLNFPYCLDFLNVSCREHRGVGRRLCLGNHDPDLSNKIDYVTIFVRDSKSRRTSKLHYWFKSNSDFAEGVNFAYWQSFSSGGSAIKGTTPSSFIFNHQTTKP